MLPALLRNHLRLLEIKERFDKRNMYGEYKQQDVTSLKNKIEELRQAYDKLKGEAKTKVTKQMEDYYDRIQTLELSRLGMLNEEEEKRYKYLIKEYNEDGKKLRMVLQDKINLDREIKTINRYIDLETRGVESKSVPSVLKNIGTTRPNDPNYSSVLEQLVKTYPKLSNMITSDEDKMYDNYGSLYLLYFKSSYPSLFTSQPVNLSPRKDMFRNLKVKNNMYLGLYLGAKLVDKKMDSFYLMLNCLEGKSLKEAGKIVQEQIGLVPIGLLGSEGDSDESLLYALFTEDDVGPLGNSLHSAIKGKKVTQESKQTPGLQASYNSALQALDFSRAGFKEELMRLMDPSIFTYDSRRGAIVGAVLALNYPNLMEEFKYEILSMDEGDLKRLMKFL